MENLPPPSFNPPSIARAPEPRRVEPVRPTPQVQRPAPPVASNTYPREWVPRVRPNKWRWIVIHHSATPSGGAAAFDKMHRARGFDELGYHFVIGNGTDTRDGQIEVGSRWPVQKWGAHAKTPDNRYNDFGIGICLVGNFEHDRPTAAQIRATARLVGYLQKTYGIPSDRVIGHGDVKPTDCPGRYLNIAEIRRLAAQEMVAMDRDDTALPKSELSAAEPPEDEPLAIEASAAEVSADERIIEEESHTVGYREPVQSAE